MYPLLQGWPGPEDSPDTSCFGAKAEMSQEAARLPLPSGQVLSMEKQRPARMEDVCLPGSGSPGSCPGVVLAKPRMGLGTYLKAEVASKASSHKSVHG